jgi:hypothetical protein
MSPGARTQAQPPASNLIFVTSSPNHSPNRIDLPVAVRGASTGFSVLLVGGLVTLLVAIKVPAVGPLVGIASAVLGFHVAARRVGTASMPALHGAFAALMAYALALPVVVLLSSGWTTADMGRAMLNLALAISTGSLTGWMNAPRKPSA